MLDGLRVLDLTDEKGFFCGKILADLGADVLKVEYPGGDPGRTIGPFYGATPHPERSLYWEAYNSSKRGITLNLALEEGAGLLKKIVKQADMLLESFPPNHMKRLGIGYEDLFKINPKIIFTSISPFGKTGPYSDFHASDISFMALSGLMKITGYPERAPLRFGLDQSYCLAGSQAAIGTLFALFNRHRTGEGQHVDVSIYECLVLSNYWEPVRWEFEKRLVNRLGDRFSRGKGSTRQVWQCKDGYVTWTMMGGRVEIERLKAIIERMDQEGIAGFLSTINFTNVHISQLSDEEIGLWEALIGEFFLRHTKAELERFSKEKNLTLCIINELEDVLDSDHLTQRKYWKAVETPEIGISMKIPGFLFKSSGMNSHVRFRAPRIGEHNKEIYMTEMGLSEQKMKELKRLEVI